MIDADTIAALRPETADDTELRESLSHGWNPELPAIQDEHGLVLVGNRRIRLAKELGIEPVIKVITFGADDAAQVARVKLAVDSNAGGAPLTAAGRKALAISLYQKRNWTQQRIGDALSVTRQMVGKYLEGISNPVANKSGQLQTDAEAPPARAEKRGRPKGSGKKRTKEPDVPKRVYKPQPVLAPDAKGRVAGIDIMVAPDVWNQFRELAAGQSMSATEKIAQLIEACVNGSLVDPTAMAAFLTDTGKKRVESAVKQRLKNVEWEIERRVMAAIVQRDEYMSKHDLEKLDDAEKIRSSYKGVISKSQYNDLLMCVHPGMSSPSEEKQNRSIQLLTELKSVLVKPEPTDTDIPRISWEEMAARRAEVRQRNSERSKQAHAARKAKQAEGATT